jgi:hypothetical protein
VRTPSPLVAAVHRLNRAPTRETVNWAGTTAALMVVALGVGLVILVVSTPIGSGDYGQWLMVSRSFGGQPDPAYRSIQDVPPLIPWILGLLRFVAPDPIHALQVLDAGLLALLVGAFYLAGATLFQSRIAGLLAAGFALVGTDQITGLFTFGGVLQAASLACTVLMVALYAKAASTERHAWAYWTIGSAALAMAALSHLATGALALAVGLAVAVFLGVAQLRGSWSDRARVLAPVIVCLAVVGTWWVLVLLPSSAPYVNNPASLNYRGPDRLVEALVGYWPTIVTIGLGLGAALAGAGAEVLHRRPRSFGVVLVWALVSVGSLISSVASQAATDYPRFTPVILAPLAVAASGGLTALGRLAQRRLQSTRLPLGSRAGLVAATLLVLAATPMAVFGYTTDARGYQVTDMESLRAAAAWIDSHVPANATVLAPVREGKWIEGLSGRAALFGNPVRYSFRSGEWARSLAADALLRSSGTSVNEFFAVRNVGGDPCDGLAASSVTIGANHEGEYVDLLRLAAGSIRLVDAADPRRTIATVSNLTAGKTEVAQTPTQIRIETLWEGKRGGTQAAYRQAAVLTANGSTMEVMMEAGPAARVGGIDLALATAPGVAITSAQLSGSEADISFTQLGLAQPRLRLTIGENAGSFVMVGKSLQVRGLGPRLRLLITDLTGSERAVSGLGMLCPAELLTRYGVGAVVLVRDAAYRDRAARLVGLGFAAVHDFGTYAVITRR